MGQIDLETNHKTINKITAIVPAYNEEERIGTVLSVLKTVPIIDEVIVVNDGSSDNTSSAARSFGVAVHDRRENGGKGAAMQTGIEAAQESDILLFIDADLIGMTPQHIEDLVQPLLKDSELMMTVGKFAGGRLSTDLAQAIVPMISGQRAVKRSFLEGLHDLSETGFGVEIAITQHAKRNKYKVEEILLADASQVMKEEKLGFVDGQRARMRMYWDIVRQVVARKPARKPKL